MSFILKDEAIFIADSHYNKKNQEFKIILEKIKNSEIFCSQIFLMGDNFDFLSNEIKYFKNRNNYRTKSSWNKNKRQQL